MSPVERSSAIRERIDEALLPLKKRAASDSSAGQSSSNSDDSSPIPPKKRRTDYVDTLRKGKVLATEESNSMAIAASEPPQKKLIHDGIRSGVRSGEPLSRYKPRLRRQRRACNGAYGSTGASCSYTHACDGATGSTSGSRLVKEEDETYAEAAAPREKKTRKKKNGPPPARSVQLVALDIPFAEVRTSSALRDRLVELGATTPQYVMKKRLEKSDAQRNQNRLLVSCKREFLGDCPITWILTEDETSHVHTHALRVSAFDRRGNEFSVKLRYLNSNSGYRLIYEWGHFLRSNGLEIDGKAEWTRKVDVELWAFRSWRLSPEGGEIDHPDGALGLLLLHSEDGRNEEERIRAPPIHEPKLKHVGEASSATAVKEEEIADVNLEQGEAVVPDMTLDEIALAAGEEMVDPLMGLLMLTRSEEMEQARVEKNDCL